jgi:hypothetical protein
MRGSIGVGSSSGARDLFTCFDTGQRRSRSFAAGAQLAAMLSTVSRREFATWPRSPLFRPPESMIRKSGCRFSEKIMLRQTAGAR